MSSDWLPFCIVVVLKRVFATQQSGYHVLTQLIESLGLGQQTYHQLLVWQFY